MNKDNFSTMSSKQRVKAINDLLKMEGNDLQKVSEFVGINYSTFTKIMQEDDYVFIKRDNQYYKFIRDEKKIVETSNNDNLELNYLIENFSLFQSLIDRHKRNCDFFIDNKLFQTDSKSSTKTFRIPEELYKEFSKACKQNFPYLNIQDVIGQLLLNFVDEYSNKK